MQIKRDASRSFFSGNRTTGISRQFLLLFTLLLIAFSLFYVSNVDHIRAEVLKTLALAPQSTPQPSEFAYIGMESFYAGELDEAILSFREAVRQRPDNIDYLYELGNLLMEADQFEDVIGIAEHAIATNPDDPRGYTLKARALMWNDSPQAIQVAIQGLDRDPNFAPLYAVQGVAYTNLGRWQEGLRMATRARELDPNNIFVQMSYQWPATYRGDYRGAIEALEIAIGLNPNLVTPYFYLARLYSLPAVNEPTMAIATYNHILELDPQNARAYLRLCETYAAVEQARFDVAQYYCDQAIRINPEYGDAYAQRGTMQYTRRNYEGAIESFTACQEHGSQLIQCHYLMGFSHYRLGNCQEAWDITNASRLMAVAANNEVVLTGIDNVLAGIQRNCIGFGDQIVPTSPPPTPLPPTPIGGFG
jgi:tetratricopeptide (TPR) repeat protein